MGRVMLLALLLAGCGGGEADTRNAAGEALEAAAIARGVVADPASATFAGAYGRGADRVCVNGTAIGIDASYGEEIACTARGTANRDGERVAITLGSGGCAFDARFDGDQLLLPGQLPDACAAFCDAPASLAGLAVDRLSAAPAETLAMRGSDGTALCPPG